MKNQPFIVEYQYNDEKILQNGFAGLLFFGKWQRKAAKETTGRVRWLILPGNRCTFFFADQGQSKKYQKRKTNRQLLEKAAKTFSNCCFPPILLRPWQPLLFRFKGSMWPADFCPGLHFSGMVVCGFTAADSNC